MPNLPRHRPAYLPQPEQRKPSGDQGFYQSRHWRKLRNWVIQGQPFCAVCATDCARSRRGVADHIIAISAGGSRAHLDNLWTLCFDCHKWKTSLEQHGLKVAGFGEDGELIPPTSERERIKAIINEKRKYE